MNKVPLLRKQPPTETADRFAVYHRLFPQDATARVELLPERLQAVWKGLTAREPGPPLRRADVE